MSLFKVVRKMAQIVSELPGMRVGDAVKRVFDATGISQEGKGFRTDRDGCGCYGRQKALNRFKLPG